MTTEEKIALALVGLAVGATGVSLVCRRRRSAGALAGGPVPPGVEDRIGVLQDAVYAAIRNPQMRELALAITGNRVFDVTVNKHRFVVQGARCPERDGNAESAAVGAWVAGNKHLAPDLAPAGQDSATALASTRSRAHRRTRRTSGCPSTSPATTTASASRPRTTS